MANFFQNLGGFISSGTPVEGSIADTLKDASNTFTDSSNAGTLSPSLGLSDDFLNSIHQLQQDAAQQQMEYQTSSADKAMQFSADEAQKNRDWQEYMSSTAYQRATEDLRKAGLNPILAAGGSSFGASTPSGSSAAGIAQAGSQAAVSEQNYALQALEVYINGITSAANAISNFLPSVSKIIKLK